MDVYMKSGDIRCRNSFFKWQQVTVKRFDLYKKAVLAAQEELPVGTGL